MTIGGYVLSAVNNTAFSINKILEYSWAGVRYAFNPKFDVTTAYYHFKQKPTEAQFWKLIKEYRDKFLLFVYQDERHQLWGQWQTSDR